MYNLVSFWEESNNAVVQNLTVDFYELCQFKTKYVIYKI